MIGAGRLCLAALFAAMLAMRLVSPVGFMPDWRAAALVPCHGTGPARFVQPTATAHHVHHSAPSNSEPAKAADAHQPCPYAMAAVPATGGTQPPLVAAVLIVAVALLLGRTYRFVERHRAHERPPLRGPPALA